MRLNFSLLGNEYVIQTAARKKRTQTIGGYTNRCHDGRFILLFDYDIKNFNWIRQEIEHLQRTHIIGDCHVFKTGKGFHVVCLDKVSLTKYVQILEQTTVDPNYIKVPLQYGQKIWTLRFTQKDGQKPLYVCSIPSVNDHMRKKSNPHRKFLQTLYPKVQFARREQCDDQEKMIQCGYKI